MSDRPRASLGRVLDDLGSTFLELVHGDPHGGSRSDIDGLVIHDPLDEPAWPRHALVLGIGVQGSQQIVHLLNQLREHDCAGLVLRAPVSLDSEVIGACARSGVALLSLAKGASWVQLVTMLRSVLGYDDIGNSDHGTLGDMPSGDLFALANAVAALLDAPITIEDRSSRVLAFSGRQDEADLARIETILGRQVSVLRTRELVERGAFRDLYRSEDPIYVEPPANDGEGFTMPRVALAIRAGDEVLGSIWAAVEAPLSKERIESLRDVSKLVALHLLSQRAGADVGRRLRADLVGTAIEGGAGANDAAVRLGLTRHRAIVLGLTTADAVEWPEASDAEQLAELQRMTDALGTHLTAAHPGSACALIGGVAYGILPVNGPAADAERAATRLGTEFLERTRPRARTIIGIGSLATGAAGLAESRKGADRAIRVLRSDRRGRRVACITAVATEALIIELADLMAARGDVLSGSLAQLLTYDVEHNSVLTQTLKAWLDASGDVAAAARTLGVHANTFRYRLRKLSQISGLDLDDPDARFAAALELRLLAAAPRSSPAQPPG